MTREQLCARLGDALEPDPHRLRGDEGATAAISGIAEPVPAAVLIGLVEREPGPAVLLTQRTDHLKAHAGQICLPGGRVEPSDPDLAATALREAEEEVGLDPGKVEVLGSLPPYDTITGYRIHPVVGWIAPPLDVSPDGVEVAEVFELPLDFVLDPANHRRQSYRRGTLTRGYFVLPYQNRFIWGATAGILVNLAGLLRV
jgi:8-oxo-dGTP pyrophosphatase MutT (NUDIX family)